MRYQVLGHRRRIVKKQKPYEEVCEFDSLEQLYYMMDKVNRHIYNEVLVIDTETNGVIASREIPEPVIKKKVKK